MISGLVPVQTAWIKACLGPGAVDLWWSQRLIARLQNQNDRVFLKTDSIMANFLFYHSGYFVQLLQDISS